MSLTIANHCLGQVPALFQQHNMDLDKYPIVLSSAEQNALVTGKDHIVKIITGHIQSPLALAGIPLEEASPQILAIHTAFQRAITSYQVKAAEAILKDQHHIMKLLDPMHVTQQNLNLIRPHIGGFLATILFPLIYAGASVYINVFSGSDVKIAGSAHRKSLLIKIDGWEEKRLEEAKDRLKMRGGVVYQTIEALMQDDEIDQKMVAELKQIAQVYEVLFPDEEFTIDNVQIQTYLDELEEKMTE